MQRGAARFPASVDVHAGGVRGVRGGAGVRSRRGLYGSRKSWGALDLAGGGSAGLQGRPRAGKLGFEPGPREEEKRGGTPMARALCSRCSPELLFGEPSRSPAAGPRTTGLGPGRRALFPAPLPPWGRGAPSRGGAPGAGSQSARTAGPGPAFHWPPRARGRDLSQGAWPGAAWSTWGGGGA